MYTRIKTKNIARAMQKEGKTQALLEELIINIGEEDEFAAVSQALIDANIATYASVHANKGLEAAFLSLYSEKPSNDRNAGEPDGKENSEKELLQKVYDLKENDMIAYARNEAMEGDPRTYTWLALDQADNDLQGLTNGKVEKETYTSKDEDSPAMILYTLR